MTAKKWVVAEILPQDGTKVFDRGLFKSSLKLGCKLHVVGVCATLQTEV